MNEKAKLEILRKLNTKDLVEKKLPEYEEDLEAAMREEAVLKDLNYGYLSSGTNDCAEVKKILATLAVQVPEKDANEKKLTAPDKEAWLMRQREENAELAAAINRQKNTTFQLENAQIAIEMAKKRLEGAKVVLLLKTAQLNFLAS